jgi:hypothetical protein
MKPFVTVGYDGSIIIADWRKRKNVRIKLHGQRRIEEYGSDEEKEEGDEEAEQYPGHERQVE